MSSNRGAQAPAKPEPAKSPRPAGSQPALNLTVAAKTNVGRSRPHNEDYVDYYIPPEPDELARKGALYMAADGMGGHSAGEVASRAAVEVVRQEYYPDAVHDIPTSLTRAFRAANQKIYNWAQSDPSKSGMGTTLVAAVILGRRVYVANVGDSRAYVIGPQGIQRITTDHSWVEEQIRAGLLTPEQAKKHPQRNVVTRALGAKPAVEVDLFEGALNEGESLFLCTDGLTGHVEDQEIAELVRRNPPEEAADLLIDLANSRGGSDNIGVVIVSAPDGESRVPTVVAAPQERPLIQRAIFAMAAVAAVLAGVLILLGGYYLFTRGGETGAPTAGEPNVTVDQVPGVLPTATLAAEGTSSDQGASTGEDTPVETQVPVDTPGPDETLAPGEPTSTLIPTSEATPTQASGSNPTKAPARRTQQPQPTQTPTWFPAASLLEPTEGAGIQGRKRFAWRWSHDPLPDDYYFDLRIWHEDDNDLAEGTRLGAVAPTQAYQVEVDLASAPAIQKRGNGDYYWSIVVVHKPCQGSACQPTIAGEWAAQRKFTYSRPWEPDAPTAIP